MFIREGITTTAIRSPGGTSCSMILVADTFITNKKWCLTINIHYNYLICIKIRLDLYFFLAVFWPVAK
jgi:hypothetical protein